MLRIHVIHEDAREFRVRRLMGVPHLLASRDADRELYCDFMEMADRAGDPFLRRELRRVADRYHARHLTETDRFINDALKRAIECQRAIAHAISRRSSGPKPLALSVDRCREVSLARD
jgi:hypothetical protein